MTTNIGYEDTKEFKDNNEYETRVADAVINLIKAVGIDKFTVVDIRSGDSIKYVPGAVSLPDGAPQEAQRLAYTFSQHFADILHAVGISSVKFNYEDEKPFSFVVTDSEGNKARLVEGADVSSVYETIAKLLPVEGRDYALNLDITGNRDTLKFSPEAYNGLGKRWCTFLKDNLGRCLGKSDEALVEYLAHDAVFSSDSDSSVAAKTSEGESDAKDKS